MYIRFKYFKFTWWLQNTSWKQRDRSYTRIPINWSIDLACIKSGLTFLVLLLKSNTHEQNNYIGILNENDASDLIGLICDRCWYFLSPENYNTEEDEFDGTEDDAYETIDLWETLQRYLYQDPILGLD